MAIHIGVDPGVKGAIAWIDDSEVLAGLSGGHVVAMPEDEDGILDVFWGLLSDEEELDASPQLYAYLEAVHAMPTDSRRGAFTFGRIYGALRMALTAVAIPWEAVTPQVWQRDMGCLTRGDKSVTRRKAGELFPDLKVTNITADALILAEYCRRTAWSVFLRRGCGD